MTPNCRFFAALRRVIIRKSAGRTGLHEKAGDNTGKSWKNDKKCGVLAVCVAKLFA